MRYFIPLLISICVLAALLGGIKGCGLGYYEDKLEDMNAGLPDMRTQWE